MISGEAWSPSGGELLYVEDRACSYDQGTFVYVVNADGTGRHVVARSRVDASGDVKGSVSRASWSPDGARIAYTSDCSHYPGAAVGCGVLVMRADGTRKQRVGGYTNDDEWCGTSDPSAAEVPVWETDGHSILVSENGLGGSAGAGVYEKNIDTDKVRRAAATEYGPEWLTLSADRSKFAFVAGTCSLVRAVGVEDGSKHEARTPRAWNRQSAPAIWLQ